MKEKSFPRSITDAQQVMLHTREVKTLMKKSTLVTLATITIVGTSLASAKDAAAFWPFDNPGNEAVENSNAFPSLIQHFIERFNINEDEARTVIDDYQQERFQHRKDLHLNYLNQAVKDGKIPEEQKQALIEKHEEWMSERENWRELTPEERQAKAQEHQEEIKTWAEENGIELSDIMPYGQGFKRGYMKGFGRGMHGRFGIHQAQ